MDEKQPKQDLKTYQAPALQLIENMDEVAGKALTLTEISATSGLS